MVRLSRLHCLDGGGIGSHKKDLIMLSPGTTAAMYNHAHIITALLEYGADPEIRDGEGRTPMYYGEFTRFLASCT